MALLENPNLVSQWLIEYIAALQGGNKRRVDEAIGRAGNGKAVQDIETWGRQRNTKDSHGPSDLVRTAFTQKLIKLEQKEKRKGLERKVNQVSEICKK